MMRRFEEFSAMEDFELTNFGLAYYDLAQYGFTFPILNGITRIPYLGTT